MNPSLAPQRIHHPEESVKSNDCIILMIQNLTCHHYDGGRKPVMTENLQHIDGKLDFHLIPPPVSTLSWLHMKVTLNPTGGAGAISDRIIYIKCNGDKDMDKNYLLFAF